MSLPNGDIRRDSTTGLGSTSLSPTAQPFNTSLPLSSSTSPRSRYFGTSPTNLPTTRTNSNSNSNSEGFVSPSSPIRTPGSFSGWVSSGGGGYVGFDPFQGGGNGGMNGNGMGSGMGMGSLGGAANTWGQGNNH